MTVIPMEPLTVRDPQVADLLRQELLRLAEIEDQHALSEKALVPYWAPCPNSVMIQHGTAKVLRETADRLLPGAA